MALISAKKPTSSLFSFMITLLLLTLSINLALRISAITQIYFSLYISTCPMEILIVPEEGWSGA